MRIRTIKPEFFDSPDTAKAPAVVRLAFIGLWCCADDTGRGTCNLKEIEGAAFPNDDISALSHGEFADIRGILRQVATAYGVVFYEVQGRHYFEIPSWSKHQRVRDGVTSRFPDPEDGIPAEWCENLSLDGGSPQSAADCGEPPLGTGEQGNRGTDIYPPTPSRSDSADAESETLQDDKSNDVDDKQSTTGPEQTTLLQEPARSPRPEPTPPEKKTPRKREAYPEEFEAFWRVYPRHADKKSAYRAWKQAVKEVSNEVLIAGAERYGRDPTRAPEYTKYAATWLRAGSWDNEPAKPARPVEAPVVSMWDYAGRGTA